MAQSPVKKLQHELDRIQKYQNTGDLPGDTTEGLLEWAAALHPKNEDDSYVDENGERQEFSVSTVETYVREMRKVATRACPDLLELTPNQFNREIDAMESGDNPNVKDGGLAKTTLMVTQSAAQTFFWYHDLGHPDEINVYGETSDAKHTEEDLFTQEEIQALRSHIEGTRNRALLEMLLNTGQRISAIQGLRIQDVDIENGYFYLNTDREGLKGADRRGRKRPLFGARKFVEKWIDVHPFADQPDSYLFIGNPEHHKTKPDEPLCQGTIRNMLQATADKANVDKPVNPHNFRHYWTTVMKQEYGLNDEQLKHLMGHKRSGNGINVVYNHSQENRLEQTIAWKTNRKEQATEKPLTPSNCESCGEDLESHWKLCPVCGERYGP